MASILSLFGFLCLLAMLVVLVVLPLRRAGSGITGLFRKAHNEISNDNFKLSDLWTIEGNLGRGQYAFYGFCLVAIKHNVDRFAAYFLFDQKWSLFNYFRPNDLLNISSLTTKETGFLFGMLFISIPFLWAGLAMTLRRLRDANLPTWLLIFFFAPFLNLLFFVTLALLPGRAFDNQDLENTFIKKFIPRDALGSATIAILASSFLALVIGTIGVSLLKHYGWTVFVGLPFVVGFFCVLIYSYHEARSLKACLGVVTLAIFIIAISLLAFMIEGIICLSMAAPLAWIVATIGAFFAHIIIKSRSEPPQQAFSFVLILPLLVVYEALLPPQVPVWKNDSVIEISAPKEAVWENVIEFSELPAPSDWILKTGIAVPLRAEIKGRGVGAVRHCIFSTGPFVEPITVWDEPNRLKFDVEKQPAAMQEWNPLGDIFPAHVDNYLVSKGGQFLLEELDDGNTRGTASTWYSHKIWPSFYWKLWSDLIIHRIHIRVLKHIKKLSESSE